MQKYTKINKYEVLCVNVGVNSLRSWMLKSTIHYILWAIDLKKAGFPGVGSLLG